MESKLLLGAILLLSSWVFVGSSQGLGLTMPCMSKLLPCQDYLRPSSTAPPSACCDALKEMTKNDQHCICDIFNNAELLNSLNVTADEALEAPKACGVPFDIKMCVSASDGEESTLPPSVAQAFEEYEKHLESKNTDSKDAPKTDADSKDAPKTDADSKDAPKTDADSKDAPKTDAAATPEANTKTAPTASVVPAPTTTSSISGTASSSSPSLSPSQGPTTSTSSVEKSFTRGFGVFILFVITWMTLFT